jgi:hypothetical protein
MLLALGRPIIRKGARELFGAAARNRTEGLAPY